VTPARTPPNLPELRPDWSRIVFIRDGDGSDIGIHVLDAGPRDADLTVVCVHGNPTWSYLWRRVVASAPPGVRVLAVDQVGMGYSARSSFPRRLADRIDDLESVVEAAGVRGRVVLVAHDWGGPVALGVAERLFGRRDLDLAGVVLTNTAVHQPEHRGSPALIAAARLPLVLSAVTQRTRGFLRATTAISSMDRASARALRAPYAHARDRRAIMEFVADIPLAIDHPSRATLDGVAEGLPLLSNVPVLLIWGMRDPVFSPRYLDDLRRRLPHAQVQQFDDAGHLVLEDRPDAIEQMWQWLHKRIQKRIQGAPSPSSKVPESDSTQESNLVGKLDALKGSSAAAVTEPSNGSWRSVSWTLLDDRVRRITSGLQARGVKPGDRVALLVPPGADLLALVYALWSLGAVIVVVDAANGPRALWRSLRGARIDHVVAIKRARPIVAALRVPGVVVWSNELADLVATETGASASGSFSDDADAAIVFTSGATGPAKPVAYSRQRIAATRDVLLEHFAFTPSDVLVAAFAPWAVLGPLLGISSVIPQMDASRPGSLTAAALSTAMEQAGGTIMWMSPAALRSVLSGAEPNTQARERLKMAGSHLRLVMIAGAPVSGDLLRDVMDLWPQADVRTPYGMTEVLPATDVSAAEVLADSTDRGVLVGRALPGVDVAIAALGETGEPGADLETTPDVLGEVALRAQHAKSRYDGRAFVEDFASRNEGWHRTGDVGMLDDKGRLWIQGRLSHVITGPRGPLGPVPMEQQVERALVSDGVSGVLVAAVGVGPAGSQVPVVVCAPSTVGRSRSDLRLADAELVDRVRAVLPDVAAVLWRSAMPVDIRHGAKIDRQKLAQEAATFLEGRS